MQHSATILWNRPVSDTCYRIGVSCPQGLLSPLPGQFVMVRIGASHDPLLRRPFSIFNLIGDPDKPQGIELLYKVVGSGTRRMSRLEPDHPLDFLGPLGKGFTRPPGPGRVYLAAGGIGVAPIHFLARHLCASGTDPEKLRVFLGGRTRDDLLGKEAFEALGLNVTLTTDDGSAGDQCLITDPLAETVMTDPPEIIYACGPHGMLQCVAGIARQANLPCQLSMETMMACGMGACLGCAVEGRSKTDRYLHVCMDGPVFGAEKLIL